jgi:hypothetical protein
MADERHDPGRRARGAATNGQAKPWMNAVIRMASATAPLTALDIAAGAMLTTTKETTMKKVLTSVLAIAVLATALPAAAAGRIDEQERRIEQRIDRGMRSGEITRREGFILREQLRDIERLEARYRRSGGLNGWERADLERRLDMLSARVFGARHDCDRRGRDRC